MNHYAFIALFSISYGIATGLTYSVPLHIAWMYFPKKEGLISGLIIAGYGLGGFIFGLVSTHYINPDDINPKVEVADKESPDDYDTSPFSPEVAEDVPRMIRRLSLYWLFILIISVSLI